MNFSWRKRLDKWSTHWKSRMEMCYAIVGNSKDSALPANWRHRMIIPCAYIQSKQWNLILIKLYFNIPNSNFLWSIWRSIQPLLRHPIDDCLLWIYYEIKISRSFILSTNVCAELGQMVTWHSFAQRTDRENERKFTQISRSNSI